MVCLELYADKTKLSSFGTEKGYPVMARIANLPVKIRNGEGIGGGCVVGWLPVVRRGYHYCFQISDWCRARLMMLQKIRANPPGSTSKMLSGMSHSTS